RRLRELVMLNAVLKTRIVVASEAKQSPECSNFAEIPRFRFGMTESIFQGCFSTSQLNFRGIKIWKSDYFEYFWRSTAT
ncbi:MAG: hypothetical protein AABZ60_04815, partial [Planctomycetota bacterium]